MSNTYDQGRPKPTFTLPTIECYSPAQVAAAEEFIADNYMLTSDDTLAAAAFLLSEQY